jgi:hypothetical protein
MKESHVTKHTCTFALVLALAVTAGTVVAAQDKASQDKAADGAARQGQKDEAQRAPQEARGTADKALDRLTPLTLEVVVSKYQAGKKISSLPYTLSVIANNLRFGRASQLRMGGQIPIPAFPRPDDKPPSGAGYAGPLQYRDIGISIDASARAAADGRFDLSISIEDTSVYPDDALINSGPRVTGMPVFRSFRSTNEMTLGHGQSGEFTAATDRISGEVIRVSATLRIAK